MARFSNLMAFALLLPLLVAGCSDDDPVTPVDDGNLAPAEQVEAFAPALEDASTRILGASSGVAIDRLRADLDRLLEALLDRDARAAAEALDEARRNLSACDATCLSPPEGSVVQLTLDHAASLME